MNHSDPYATPQTQNPISESGQDGRALSFELIELQHCRDAESVEEVTSMLDEAGIFHRVGSTAANFDLASIGSGSDAQMVISIRAQDYDSARAIMESESLKTELPENHYLLVSTDDELAEIVGHSSEWSAFDVAHSKRLLKERGVDSSKIEKQKNAHLEKLKIGKKASGRLLFFGWLFSILGGVIGIGIAWSLCYMKEKTPDGEFFTYDARSRKTGSNMLFVACLMAAVGLGFRLFVE